MQLTELLDGMSVLDKLFFKMKFKECFISWCWPHTILIIFVGFTALQTSGLVKKQKNQICSYNNNLYQNQSIGRESTAPDTNCIVKSLYH